MIALLGTVFAQDIDVLPALGLQVYKSCLLWGVNNLKYNLRWAISSSSAVYFWE